MTLREILATKGTDVFTTTKEVTLQRVVEILVENNCGSLVVVDRNDDCCVIGIITERDIMISTAAGKALATTSVEATMSVNVISGRADDSVAHTMGLMTEKRIRHLPVIENDRLSGLISIGDVVKAEYNALSAENHQLKSYIQS